MGAIRAFSGKVGSGFPSENATKAKMPERFLFPVGVKPLRALVCHARGRISTCRGAEPLILPAFLFPEYAL
jgi:hypothetical protein